MAAAYDTYDYPSYWAGREYEHQAELVAIKAFLNKIPNIRTILEIGAGYGRLTPSYIFRASRVILSDPSAKLLELAKRKLNSKKVKFIKVKVENIPDKVRSNSVDLVIIVRVLHHINDLDKMFTVVRKVCKKNGYFILEFANKRHLKATIDEFIHGNFTFPLDIYPKDISTRKKVKSSLPFKNYHPDIIGDMLKKYGFSPIEIRSVSNVRSTFLKRLLPTEFLLGLERITQKPLARFYFGPSIFILSKNTG